MMKKTVENFTQNYKHIWKNKLEIKILHYLSEIKALI